MRARTSIVTASALTLVTLTALPATAATPANDNIANATVISSLPYTIDEDISGATKETGEPRPSCDRGTRGTVWWTITPSASGWLVADTHGSEIRTVAAVYSGSPGALTRVACNDDTVRNGHPSQKARVYWKATAGTQYYLQVAKDFGRGGLLHLKVNNSAPPFSVDSITVDSSGSVESGAAVISGSMSCTSGPGEVYLEVAVRQQWARVYITGDRSRRISCDGVTTWSAKVSSQDGAFGGGKADVKVRARWEEGNGGSLRAPLSTVLLHG
jgi:hypothetical protein